MVSSLINFLFAPTPSTTSEAPLEIDVYDLPEASSGKLQSFDGEKFFGGLNEVKIYELDYWTLREFSRQLFFENIYARGALRRYVTNIINTGLMLESTPEEALLGLEHGALGDWTEDVENRFNLWAKSEELCDYNERLTWYAMQAQIKFEALVHGDILLIFHYDPKTRLPKIQMVNAGAVENPLKFDANIIEGIEYDKKGRQVAYWVTQKDNSSKRVPAWTTNKRRRAMLVYGTDKLNDSHRGEPLLSIILQSLKEIDRYRDSTQRKAVINSLLAMFIKQTQNKVSSLPVTGGATRNSSVQVSDNTTPTRTRNYTMSQQGPGLVYEGLQVGEEPVQLGGGGTDINFGIFEKAIVDAMAWCLEMPPEILKLAFSSNYSASQAATNEFKMFLNKERTNFGDQPNQKVYTEFFYGSVITGKISAPGFLAAWFDNSQYDIKLSWLTSQWSGAIKPSADPVKQGKAYQIYTSEGWCTNDRASKELTGTKYSKNIKQLARENAQKAEAMRPILELRQEFGTEQVEKAEQEIEEYA